MKNLAIFNNGTSKYNQKSQNVFELVVYTMRWKFSSEHISTRWEIFWHLQ